MTLGGDEGRVGRGHWDFESRIGPLVNIAARARRDLIT